MEVQRVAEELEEAERRRQAEIRAAIEEAERKGTQCSIAPVFCLPLLAVRLLRGAALADLDVLDASVQSASSVKRSSERGLKSSGKVRQ
jgi:hypothetical protein